MAKVRRQKIPYVAQAKKLEKVFPSGRLVLGHNGFSWAATMTPTPLSGSYEIKLQYKLEKHPDVFVTSNLELAEGKKSLPHVYSTEKQHLCLYHRQAGQWHGGMWIHETIIPWVNEWLFFYEYWLLDGKWHGGGIDHGKRKPYLKTEN